jgi:hypothetical protein
MPEGHPAQLPTFASLGNQAPATTPATLTARSASCALAVRYCLDLMNDSDEASALRLKAAIGIMDKALPTVGSNAA